ncbi:MAG: DUF494 family protein [Nitrospirota bacterium]
MIHLFSLIADQVRDKKELFDDEGKIMQSLINNGYHIYEADAALMLMQTFVQRQAEQFFPSEQGTMPIRSMNLEERERISLEAFAFLTKMTYLGIFTEDQREEIIEKALNMYGDHIELEHIKSLINLILFPSTHEMSTPASGLRHRERTAWN